MSTQTPHDPGVPFLCSDYCGGDATDELHLVVWDGEPAWEGDLGRMAARRVG